MVEQLRMPGQLDPRPAEVTERKRARRVIRYLAHAAIRSAIASGASMCRK